MNKNTKIVSSIVAVPLENVELVPRITDTAHAPFFQSILGSPSSGIADAFKPPARRGLHLDISRRTRVVKPLIAPAGTVHKLNLSLAQKQCIFRSRKINDVWTLYFDFRSQFPRPDESDPAVRRLCANWKSKVKGRSPLSLQRFFRQHPDVAAWATWTEKAIQETAIRSSKNKFPRLELLRECISIMAQHRLDDFGM